MTRRKGFTSLLILSMSLVLVTFGLLIMSTIHHSTKLEGDYLDKINMRNVADIAMGKLRNEDSMTAYSSTKELPFILGNQQCILKENISFSSDNNFRLMEVVANCGDRRYALRTYDFFPTQAVQDRAGSYVFSMYSSPSTNTKKYMGTATYSTGKTFTSPKPNLEKIAVPDWEDVRRMGFGRFVQKHKKTLSHDENLTISKGNYACDAMLIVTGDLKITAGSTFTGRMVILVQGATTIGSSVTMDDVFLLSYGSITIGSGCNLTGHLRTNASLILNGNGTFAGRSDAGRPFRGAAQVW